MSVAARLVAYAEGDGSPFADQVEHFRQKVSLPTKGYADVMGLSLIDAVKQLNR